MEPSTAPHAIWRTRCHRCSARIRSKVLYTTGVCMRTTKMYRWILLRRCFNTHKSDTPACLCMRRVPGTHNRVLVWHVAYVCVCECVQPLKYGRPNSNRCYQTLCSIYFFTNLIYGLRKSSAKHRFRFDNKAIVFNGFKWQYHTAYLSFKVHHFHRVLRV